MKTSGASDMLLLRIHLEKHKSVKSKKIPSPEKGVWENEVDYNEEEEQERPSPCAA